MADRKGFGRRIRAEFRTFERAARECSRLLWGRRRAFLITSLILLGVALGFAGWNQKHLALLGWMRGEAFYRGLPTSYWRAFVLDDGRARGVTPQTRVIFHDPTAFEVLAVLAKDPDADVRWPAVHLLRSCGAPPEKVVVQLMDRLSDSDPNVLLPSIDGLGALEAFALPAAPTLARLADSKDEEIAIRATYALWEIDAEAAKRQGGWKRLAPENVGVAVAMPSAPVRSESVVKSRLGDVSLVRFRVSKGLADWNLAVAEYNPSVAETYTEEERFDLAARLVSEGLGVKLIRDQPVQQRGLRGHDYTRQAERHGLKYVLRSRTFLVGQHSFDALVVFVEGMVSERAVDHFLDSLEPTEISDEKEPLKARDGSSTTPK